MPPSTRWSDWGYEKQILRTTYLATGRSVIEYGTPALHPWLSKSSLELLEKAQRFAGRTICGLVKGPNDAALLDANIPSVRSRSQQSAMMAYDKSIRLKPENPRRQTADAQQRMRTMNPDWRENSRRWTQLFEGMELSYFLRETVPRVCISSCEFFYTPVRKTDTEETQRRAGEKTIEETSDVDVTFYTEDSAEEGTRNDGEGVVVRDGSDTLLELSEAAGQLTSSFQAELTAIRTAVREAIEKYVKKRIRIVTDSRSSLLLTGSKASAPTSTRSVLWRKILDGITQFEGRIRWVWCLSHCGVEGNEKADRCAATGCSLEQKPIPLNFDTAKAQIRKTYKDDIKHELCKKVYTRRTDDKHLNRKEQVNISRLRSGHHPELRYWRKKINEIEDDTCRLCGTDSETAEHVIKCPGTRDTIPQE